MAGEFVAGAIVSKLLLDTKKWSTSVSKVNADQKSMMGMSEKTSQRFQMVGKSMVVAGALIVGGMGKAVAVFGDFDQAMTESLSIMGDVSEGLRTEMKNAAIEMSTESTFAAKELGEAYFFLASAGLDAEKSISALPIVTRFAQAGAFDLASATDLLTDAQSALGLSVDDVVQNEENMVAVSDVLVKANTLANAKVSEFSESLTNKAGAAMRAYGIELETGVAVLAAFADQGTKGADAGTQFSIVLRELQKAALQNKKAFKEAGVAVFDASGNLNNMGDIVGQLEERLIPMSAEQRKAEMGMLGFSEKSQMALLTLLGTSEKIKEYEINLRAAGGITQEVSDKQLKSFNNQMTISKNKITASALALGEQLAPSVVAISEKVSTVIGKISEWARANPALFGTITKLVAASAALMVPLGTFLMMLPRIVAGMKLMKLASVGLSGSFLPLAAAILAAVAAYKLIKLARDKWKAAAITDTVDAETKAWSNLVEEMGGWTTFAETAAAKMVPLKDGAEAYRAKIEELNDIWHKYGENTSETMKAIARGDEGQDLKKFLEEIGGKTLDVAAAESELESSVDSTSEAVKIYNEILKGLAGETKDVETAIKLLPPPFTAAEQKVYDLAAAFNSGRISMTEYHQGLDDLKKGVTKVFDPDEYPMAEMNEEIDITMEYLKSQPDALASVLDAAGIKIAGVNLDLVEDVKTTAGETTTIWGEATDGLVTKWSGMIGEWVASGDIFKGDFKALGDSLVSIMSDTAGQMLSEFVSKFIKGVLSSSAEAGASIASNIGESLSGAGAESVASGIKVAAKSVSAVVDTISGVITAVATVAALFKKTGPSSTDSWHFQETWKNTKETRDWHFANHQARLDEMAKALTGTIPDYLFSTKMLIKNLVGNKYLNTIAQLTGKVAANTKRIADKTGKAQTGAIHMQPGLFAVGEDAPRIPEITAPIASLARLFGGGGGSRTQLFLTVNNETQEIDLNEGVQEIMITATPELTRQGRMKVNTNALVKER